jgi:hypothetical protein
MNKHLLLKLFLLWLLGSCGQHSYYLGDWEPSRDENQPTNRQTTMEIFLKIQPPKPFGKSMNWDPKTILMYFGKKYQYPSPFGFYLKTHTHTFSFFLFCVLFYSLLKNSSENNNVEIKILW